MTKIGFEEGQKLALISVFDKTGIVEFAQGLKELGWKIISSGGTAKKLSEAGVAVTDVAELVGGAAILGHRVVTLSREIGAALLADTQSEADMAEMKKLDLPIIGMVVCDFYPLLKAITEHGENPNKIVEMTDIGGPNMVREAAKGGRIVICDANDRNWVLNELKVNGDMNEDQRQWMRAKAEKMVADYVAASAVYHSQGRYAILSAEKAKDCAYAENRCQNPAELLTDNSNDPLALSQFMVVAGDPSYISFADADAILQIMCTLAESFYAWKDNLPFIAIAGKHGNPCGAAIDWVSPAAALEKALMGDSVAVMGGEVITNFPIDNALGQLLFQVPSDKDIGRDKWGLDLILAPSFSEATIELLGKKEKRRLMANKALETPAALETDWIYKPVRGSWLRQKPHPLYLTPKEVDHWAGQPLSDSDFESLLLAWSVCWKASSNTVALAKNNMLIGLGCGQQDRIACVRLCLERAKRAGHETDGAFFASDAFWPFATSQTPDMTHLVKKAEKLVALAFQSSSDRSKLNTLALLALAISASDNREGTELLIAAGCKGGIVPADGNKLPEVEELFTKARLSVAFLHKDMRGFAKH